MKIRSWKRRQINYGKLPQTPGKKAEAAEDLKASARVKITITSIKPTQVEDEEDAVTLPETPEKKLEAEAAEDLKEAVPPLVHNDKSAMLIQAFEVAKEEAAGMEAQTMLGDMEITLSIKPTQMPMDASAEENASAEKTELEFSNPSPTSQFEFDVIHATHKSHSFALMDEERSISSEESLSVMHSEVDSLFSAAESTQNGVADGFVEEVLSPMVPLADYLFCKMDANPALACYWREAHDELSVKGNDDAKDNVAR